VRRQQGGFTLVELMVGMVLTTLLIGFVFTIFVQTSSAFRAQSQISDLQQALVAAETVIGREVRQAGLGMPDGVRVAFDADVHQAIEIVNASDGPDELRVLAADPAVQARVTALALGADQITVDDASVLEVGQVLVLSDPQAVDPAIVPAPPQTFDACVVQIAEITGTTVTLSTAAPWGQPGNAQCADVAANNATSTEPDTMAFGLRMRGYRIDATRPELGVLQRSVTAGLLDDWEDLGIGFTDLQVATRWHDPGDGSKEWYSGDDQTTLTEPAAAAPTTVPVELTLSLVVRTLRDVSGVASTRTPSLVDVDDPDHNAIGDRASVPHDGQRIYRWSTQRIDLRNLGVGR
jgi:Tfp pilus assembly protein PilE